MALDLEARLNAPGPKRILALDGGGVRGILALAFLERIEQLLANRGEDPNFRLCDYYDLIGGTSTGAIIASGLAMGFSVNDLIDFYRTLSERIFRPNLFVRQVTTPKFDAGHLREVLEDALGDITLGSDKIRTGLAIFLKRLDTSSAWILTNNPKSAYFSGSDRGKDTFANKDFRLTEVVRASTAAPHYFEPEEIQLSPEQSGVFVDGGVSPYNNPALGLFLVSQLDGYGFNWASGADQLMLTSVGTGEIARRHSYREAPFSEKLLRHPAELVPRKVRDALMALTGMMQDASELSDTIMQAISECKTPWKINSQIGSSSSETFGAIKMLSYARYNIILEEGWLSDNLGTVLEERQVARLQKMDRPEILEELLEMGRIAAKEQIDESHFSTAFDLTG